MDLIHGLYLGGTELTVLPSPHAPAPDHRHVGLDPHYQKDKGTNTSVSALHLRRYLCTKGQSCLLIRDM